MGLELPKAIGYTRMLGMCVCVHTNTCMHRVLEVVLFSWSYAHSWRATETITAWQVASSASLASGQASEVAILLIGLPKWSAEVFFPVWHCSFLPTQYKDGVLSLLPLGTWYSNSFETLGLFLNNSKALICYSVDLYWSRFLEIAPFLHVGHFQVWVIFPPSGGVIALLSVLQPSWSMWNLTDSKGALHCFWWGSWNWVVMISP